MALDGSQREQDARHMHTGRYLLMFRSGSVSENITLLRCAAGLRLAASSDFGAAYGFDPSRGEGVVLESLGMALVRTDVGQALRLILAAGTHAFELTPERHLRGEQVANFDGFAAAAGDTAFET
jgi:hypothetical protein